MAATSYVSQKVSGAQCSSNSVSFGNRRLRIIYLASNRSNGKVVKAALEHLGCEDVVVSISPREVLGIFMRKRFDLLITTLHPSKDLPDEISVREAIWRIRAGRSPAPRGLPIMVIAVEDDIQGAHDLMELGVGAILASPITLRTLRDRIYFVLTHPHLAQVGIDAIDAKDDTESEDVPANLSRNSYSLPFAALGEGMYLVDPITIHDRVLIPAGTCLRDLHLHAIEQMEHVLDGKEARVRFFDVA